MNDFTKAAVSGAVAGVPMTAFMSYMHQRLPPQEKGPLPPKQITTDAMKDMGVNRRLTEKERRALTMLAHFSYSILTGSLYWPLFERLRRRKILGGAAFGLVVWSASYLGWVPLTGWGKEAWKDTPKRNALMIGAHVIWGASLAIMMDTLERRKKLAGF